MKETNLRSLLYVLFYVLRLDSNISLCMHPNMFWMHQAYALMKKESPIHSLYYVYDGSSIEKRNKCTVHFNENICHNPPKQTLLHCRLVAINKDH